VSMTHSVFSSAFGTVSGRNSNDSEQRGVTDRAQTQQALMRVYNFAGAIAMFTHITTLLLGLTIQALPSLFPPGYGKHFHPMRVLVPRYSGRQHVSSIAEGAMIFMQWDEAISLTAMLLWSLILLDLSYPLSRGWELCRLMCEITVGLVVIGPAATMVELIKRSDRLLYIPLA